jgi:uncharacterized GH25 family protein
MKHKSLMFLALCASPAWAHDTWMLPARFRIEPGQTLRLDLTSAMDFPNPETPVRPDRLVEAKVRLAGVTLPLAPIAESKALALTSTVDKAGIAVAWVASRERALQLTADEVAHYLEEIGANETIGQQWRKAGQKPWRETYAKRAKSIVRVGPGDADDSWKQPCGLDLELVPESDPTALVVGDTLSLRLLWQGRPLSGLAVGAVSAPPARPAMATTDAEGRVSFVLSKAGPWLVRATRIVASEIRFGEWDSLFTTLTVEARSH